MNRYLQTTVQKNIMGARQAGGDDEVIALTVSHFLGAYLILAIGCGLATVAFVLEALHSRFSGNSRQLFKRRVNMTVP